MLVLTFQVNQILYAVPASRVIEVVPHVELRPVPHAPACVLGLLRYHGSALAVLDLGLLLGGVACVDRLDTRIILVRATPGSSGDDRLGLLAERVNELVDVDPTLGSLRPARQLDAPYLGSVHETATGLLQLIDPGQITLTARRDALGVIAP